MEFDSRGNLFPYKIIETDFVESTVLGQTERRLHQLRQRFRPEVDSYFIEILSTTHPKYYLFEMNRTEWLFTFSTNRSFQSKGIIQINF